MSSLIYIRLSCKEQGRRIIGASDFFVILAWSSFFIYGSLDTLLYRYGFVPTGTASVADTIVATKVWYAQNIVGLDTAYAVKAAMLIHYFSFIPAYLRRMRVALWIISGLVFMGWVTQFFLIAFWCLPVSRLW